MTALQNQVTADESALAAVKAQSASQLAVLQGQLAADEAAAKVQSAQIGTQIAQTVAAVIPSPFGGIATSLIGLAGVGLVAYFGHASVASTNTTAQASSANHTAQITAAIQAVADSVPVSAHPGKPAADRRRRRQGGGRRGPAAEPRRTGRGRWPDAAGSGRRRGRGAGRGAAQDVIRKTPFLDPPATHPAGLLA